jgi:hypothetical protein
VPDGDNRNHRHPDKKLVMRVREFEKIISRNPWWLFSVVAAPHKFPAGRLHLWAAHASASPHDPSPPHTHRLLAARLGCSAHPPIAPPSSALRFPRRSHENHSHSHVLRTAPPRNPNLPAYDRTIMRILLPMRQQRNPPSSTPLNRKGRAWVGLC